MRHVTLLSVNSIKVPRGVRTFASKVIGSMGNARLQARPSKGPVQYSSRSGTAADDVSRSADDQLSGYVRKLDLPSGAQPPKDRCALSALMCCHCCCSLLAGTFSMQLSGMHGLDHATGFRTWTHESAQHHWQALLQPEQLYNTMQGCLPVCTAHIQSWQACSPVGDAAWSR